MAGFVDFEITWRDDIFSGAPQASSAANFGTVGINFRARKPESMQEWQAALSTLNCNIQEQQHSGNIIQDANPPIVLQALDK